MLLLRSLVVDVLQAVNLLLTMDLFMVVVAVDPRWLLRSLRGELPEASVVAYLDKIFHIPFALRPRARVPFRSGLPSMRQRSMVPSVTLWIVGCHSRR